jgi:MATE family multidrug resistance protein
MSSHAHTPDHDYASEPRWAGVREVMTMSWPIILGSMSYTFMDFIDKVFISQVEDSTRAIAAAGAAGLVSYTLCTLALGIIGCVGTFVAQSIGRGTPELSASYTWQGIYLSVLAGLLSLLLWPLAPPLFELMRQSPDIIALEVPYFQLRLPGYMAMAWMTALAAFFQAVGAPRVPMYAAIITNVSDIFMNYALIFGKFGFPEMGLNGAAFSTTIAQWFQVAMLMSVFLSARFNGEYRTRASIALHIGRIRELIRVGSPAGVSMFLDIFNWSLFTVVIVGSFGAVQLAAHNIAISFMHVAFMPALALNQGIAPIVGRWIGRRDFVRARKRSHTAIYIAVIYMSIMAGTFAIFGRPLIDWIFSDDPEVIALGQKLLILAGIFQGFDAIGIVTMGALRGAGDTRWMMWATLIVAYGIFIPMALFFAFTLNGQAFGGWIAAAIYIIIASAVLLWRFNAEKWRDINIFSDEDSLAEPVLSPAK